MAEPVLWAGLLMLAGAVGAMVARAANQPAALGSLIGGMLVAGGIIRFGEAAGPPDVRDLFHMLLALVGFQLGAEIELSWVVTRARSLAAPVILQTAAAGGMVWLAALLLGFDGLTSAALGIALAPASPAALAAVHFEDRPRGDLTQRLLAMTVLSLLASVVCMELVFTPSLAWRLGLDLALGLLIGAVTLMPLSRMSLGGAIVAAAMACAFLLSLAARSVPAYSHLLLMSLAAGWLCGTFSPNRDRIRDALRGIGVPAVIGLFAMAGSHAVGGDVWAGLPAALLLVSARSAGVVGSALLTGGGGAGLAQGIAQTSIAGLAAGGPLLASSLGSMPGPSEPWIAAVSALLVAEAAGMIGIRWALRRAGEATDRDDPSAWRDRMR